MGTSLTQRGSMGTPGIVYVVHHHMHHHVRRRDDSRSGSDGDEDDAIGSDEDDAIGSDVSYTESWESGDGDGYYDDDDDDDDDDTTTGSSNSSSTTSTDSGSEFEIEDGATVPTHPAAGNPLLVDLEQGSFASAAAAAAATTTTGTGALLLPPNVGASVPRKRAIARDAGTPHLGHQQLDTQIDQILSDPTAVLRSNPSKLKIESRDSHHRHRRVTKAKRALLRLMTAGANWEPTVDPDDTSQPSVRVYCLVVAGYCLCIPFCFFFIITIITIFTDSDAWGDTVGSPFKD